MLAIILGILKVIGITLLVLLGISLLILALVLFVPIRYKGDGQLNDVVKEVHLRVTWLLRAVSVQVNYSHPDKPQTIIKVLGINIDKFKKPKKEEPKQEETPKQESGEPKPKKEKKKKEKKPRYDINTALLSDDEASGSNHTDSKEDNDSASQNSADTEEPVSENIRKMVEQAQALQKETWRDKLKTIVNKITSVYNKIKDIFLNIKYYMDILQEEDTKAMIKLTLDALLDILKKLLPKKLIAHIQYGFETPDKTGQILGLYWMFKPALGKDVEVVPNFEEKILEGDIYLKGRITVFTILVNALKVVLDKRFKPLINKFKNGGKSNGREAE